MSIGDWYDKKFSRTVTEKEVEKTDWANKPRNITSTSTNVYREHISSKNNPHTSYITSEKEAVIADIAGWKRFLLVMSKNAMR